MSQPSLTRGALIEALSSSGGSVCEHEWTDRGMPGDYWRECWICGTQEDR